MENSSINNPNVTLFCEVYCKFLSKITDDMYLELTCQDTLKMLKSMLLSAIVNFKYPKNNIRNYYLAPSYSINCSPEAYKEIEETANQRSVTEYCDCSEVLSETNDLSNLDHWQIKLDIDEVEILALAMKLDWLGQQLDSKELLKMRPQSSDFELPSQANHIAKLTEWYRESENQLKILQDLYNRRTVNEIGMVSPNFEKLGGKKRVCKKQVRI